MLAITIVKGTKYACNLKFETDYARKFRCLQAYLVNFERDCKSVWNLRLQACLVRIVFFIATIFGLFFHQNCNHFVSQW